jgi:hypothetical protein
MVRSLNSAFSSRQVVYSQYQAYPPQVASVSAAISQAGRGRRTDPGLPR